MREGFQTSPPSNSSKTFARGMSDATPLWQRYLIDATAAISASFLLAPFVATVDVSLIKNASGTEPLIVGVTRGMKDTFLRPHVWLRRPEFFVAWAVYGVTYSVANMTNSTAVENKVSSAMLSFLNVGRLHFCE
jgi:hypothetical protein